MKPTAPPPPPTESPWARGSRTVRQAMAETGLSRQRLWELMNEGVVPWFILDEKGTRLIAWGALCDYLDTLHKQYAASQSATD